MSLYAYICGTYTVRLPLRARRIYFGLLIQNGIPVVKSVPGEEGNLYVTLRTGPYRRYLALLRRRNLPLPELTDHRGLPVWIKRAAARPGMIAGACIAAAIVILSTMFCWRVDVICLDNAWAVRDADYVDTEAVKAELASMGVGTGLFLPGFDVRSAENRFLIQSDSVSWMAINRRGTVLSVEVRSSHAVTDEKEGDIRITEDGLWEGMNLVADADGKIVRFAVEDGNIVVSAEQMVMKGDLLAAGIFESSDGDVRYSCARGKVWAETIRQLRAEIPLQVTEDIATGKTETRYTGHFFRFSLPVITRSNVTFLEIFQNWRKKTGFSDGEYDTIIDEHILTLPDETPLPFTCTAETRLYKTRKTRTLTGEEALALAERSLAEQLSGMPDVTVLSTETNTVWEDDRLIVMREVYCIDNIAEQKPFYIHAENGTTQ